uniref:DUF7610 domain-containing protein n=1 Tax=Cajanus cajan TaxID=3821 RepID=A0A151TLK5_CAJCA|nr:hypothetical protein KK1_021525 [Cajanus cajan]
MTKSYKNVEAELEELQSMLDEALLLGPETESHDSISNDIKQRFAFIGNLLSAEVASHPSKPHHLHHVSERLATMEREFHHWDSFRTLPFHDLDKDSTCSCTDSCLNDDGDETELTAFEENNGSDKFASLDYEDAEDFLEDFGGDNELVEFDGGILIKTRKDNGLEREERRESRVGNKCCAVAAGVLVGIIFMGFIMVNISDCFRFVEQVSFAAPT